MEIAKSSSAAPNNVTTTAVYQTHAETAAMRPWSEAELNAAEAHDGTQGSSAAPLCGKPPAFRPMPQAYSSSTQTGRVSLPACVWCFYLFADQARVNNPLPRGEGSLLTKAELSS